jgi:hypothetical protein
MLLVIELTHQRSKIFRMEFGTVVILVVSMIILVGSLFAYLSAGVIAALPSTT